MSLPTYRLHRPTGQAVVTVRLPDRTRHDLYLGVHGSARSKAEYRRVLALIESNGGVYPAATADPTVNEALVAFVRFITTHYRDEDGRPGVSPDEAKKNSPPNPP